MAGSLAGRILLTLAARGSLVRSARYDNICAVPEIFPGPGVVQSVERFGYAAAVRWLGNWWSRIVERLAVEHGGEENCRYPIGRVNPRGPVPQEELRRLRGCQGCRLPGIRWRVFRFSGSERGREDHDDEDDLRGGNTDERRARCGWPRRLPLRAGDQAPHRGRPAGEQPRRRAQGKGEPAHLRQVLRPSPQACPPANGRAPRLHAAFGEG